MAGLPNLKDNVEEQKSFVFKNSYFYDYFCEHEMQFYEKKLLSNVVRGMEKNGFQRYIYVSKSNERANEKRDIGNKLFNAELHDESTHRNTFVYYTESIAAAPNDSEELSLGYSNRATLLCHLHKYEECLKDCDRAIDTVKSDRLKVKLLFRKAEALIGLKDYTKAKDVWTQANSLLEKTNLSPKLMEIFSTKSQNFSKVFDNALIEDNVDNAEEESADKLPVFEPNNEVPSASKAITIKYNEEWGRHIVAARCIEPGEILVKEKSYFSFLKPPNMYLFCSHCTKPSWNLIPCKGCVFDVYCSDECRLEANEKYHKFECPIFPYLCEKDSDIEVIFYHLRFLLLAVHNAGGLLQLKQAQTDAQISRLDPRKKGFTDDDTFYSNELRSWLFLSPEREKKDCAESLLGSDVCYTVYHLATKTDFFGKKFDITPIKIISEPFMLFFAGLMFRHVSSLNSIKPFLLKNYHPNGKISVMGSSIHPLCHLFNNSCSSNAYFLFTEDNEVIMYATRPIEKESQVFISYCQGNILFIPKIDRNKFYEFSLNFSCKCIPCEENWSHICLPLLKDLLETAPDTLTSIELMLYNLNNQIAQDSVYKQELMNEVIKVMIVIAEKATVICEEYRTLEKVMKIMFIKSFGKKPLIFSNSC